MTEPDSTTSTPPTWPCPNCGGFGCMPDGSVVIRADGKVEVVPATTCWICRGKGRVRVLPLEEQP